MMERLGIQFVVELEVRPLLDTLRKNRTDHVALVKEARAGYCQAGIDAVRKKLVALEAGKAVQLNDYAFSPPHDYSEAYDTAIAMLENHKGNVVKLNGDEYRHLVQDIWGWTAAFINHNQNYSPSTRDWAAGKGLRRDEE